MNLPTGARGRMVASAILLIVIILAAQYVIGPTLNLYFDGREDIDSMQRDIHRYQRLLGELPALKKANERLDRSPPLRPYLLAGNNQAIAAAKLQKRLQDIADSRGAKIASLRVRDPEIDGTFQRVTVEIHLKADMQALRDVLYEMENSRPLLFTEALSIQARVKRRGVSGSELEARITLYGLRAPDSMVTEG